MCAVKFQQQRVTKMYVFTRIRFIAERCGPFKFMKIPFQIFLLTLLTSCSSLSDKDNGSDTILNGVKWENQDLDFIGFDSTLIYVPIKNEYPTTCAYNFEMYSDTLMVINKTVNAYNIINFKDSISLLKINYLK